jgi:hypothetical protein
MIEGDPDPGPYLLLTNPHPDPGGLKTYGSGILRVLASAVLLDTFPWLQISERIDDDNRPTGNRLGRLWKKTLADRSIVS